MSIFQIGLRANLKLQLQWNIRANCGLPINGGVHFQTVKSVLHKDCGFNGSLVHRMKSSSQRLEEFGPIFTDHMLKIEYDEKLGGWLGGTISPFQEINLHPAAKVFNKSCSIFESMKARKGVDGKIRLFRPELNLDRLNKSAMAASLPQIDEDYLLDHVQELISIDKHWVPTSSLSSLHIKTTIIATDSLMHDGAIEKALLFVTLSLCGPYFDKHKAIGVIANQKHKMQNEVSRYNYHEPLWLYGDEEQLTEMNFMNVFLLYINENEELELVTPPLNGLVYPGITRFSILELAKEWNINVKEKEFAMADVLKLIRGNKLLEMFGCGNVNVVCPISEIVYKEKLYKIPTMEHSTPLYLKFYNTLINIQYGKISHPWAPIVDVNLYEATRNEQVN